MKHQKVLRISTVVDRVGLCRSSIYNLMNAGKFPRAVRLSENAVAWRESDIDQWLSEREAA